MAKNNKLKRLKQEMKIALDTDNKLLQERIWMEARQHLNPKDRKKFQAWLNGVVKNG